MTGDAQATVRRFDADGGSAVLDDGTEVALPAGTLVGARVLHRGQRVHLVLSGGVVLQVRLP